MTYKMELWNKVKTPPDAALKPIKGGRMVGKTDIDPMWRLQALTEQLGPIGGDWWYEIIEHWTEHVHDEVICTVRINLYTGDSLRPIPGIGSNKILVQENKGPHVNDEGYKMALTDALSVAMKQLGVAADVYMGKMDSSKYNSQPRQPQQQPSSPAPTPTTFMGWVAQRRQALNSGMTDQKFFEKIAVSEVGHIAPITAADRKKIGDALHASKYTWETGELIPMK